VPASSEPIITAEAPAGDRLGDVAGELDAAVGDDGNVLRLRGFDRRHDGGQLRHADAGDDAGGADRARADADLDGIRAGIDQRRVPPAVATLPAMMRTELESFLTRVTASRTRAEWPWAVSTTRRIDAGLDQALGALETVLTDADGGGGAQAALHILGGVRVELRLLDVLDGDQADAAAFASTTSSFSMRWCAAGAWLPADRRFP
jgi:hypothetical protein